MNETTIKVTGGTIVANPTGSFTARYWLDGKQRERTFRDTPGSRGSGKRLARDFLLKLTVSKREGDATFTDNGRGIAFMTYAGSWVEAHANEATRAVMRSTLKRLAPYFTGKTLLQVANDRELAQRAINEAPGSYAKRTRIVIVSPLNEAVKAGKLASHRLRGLKVVEPERAVEFAPASKAQLDRMALALGDRAALVWLGAYAGLRLGESLGVNVSDFREDGTVLRIRRQRAADGTVTDASGKDHPLKGRQPGQFRDIPVSPELWAKIQSAPRDAEGWLFRSEWRRSTQDAFNRARDAAGLSGAYVPHTLRHQFASVLLGAGVSVVDVSAWLGHKSPVITLTVYAHSIPSAASHAREVISRAMAA